MREKRRPKDREWARPRSGVWKAQGGQSRVQERVASRGAPREGGTKAEKSFRAKEERDRCCRELLREDSVLW